MTTPLERLRAERELTQREVSEMAGVNRMTIVRAEAGNPPGRYATRLKIARALGVSVEDLFDEVEEAVG